MRINTSPTPPKTTMIDFNKQIFIGPVLSIHFSKHKCFNRIASVWADCLWQNDFRCPLLLPKVNYAHFLSKFKRGFCAKSLNVVQNIKTKEPFAPLCGSEQLWALKKLQIGPPLLQSSFKCTLNKQYILTNL